MSRYNLDPIKPNSKLKPLMFIVLIIAFIFSISYQYESRKEKDKQSVVSKDYEICLQAVCINRLGYNECIYLDSPHICNVKEINISPFSKSSKRIEIDPLPAKCEE